MIIGLCTKNLILHGQYRIAEQTVAPCFGALALHWNSCRAYRQREHPHMCLVDITLNSGGNTLATRLFRHDVSPQQVATSNSSRHDNKVPEAKRSKAWLYLTWIDSDTVQQMFENKGGNNTAYLIKHLRRTETFNSRGMLPVWPSAWPRVQHTSPPPGYGRPLVMSLEPEYLAVLSTESVI